MGIHVPEDDKDIYLDIGKGAGKNALGLLPGGPQLGEAIDAGVALFLKDYEYKGYSKDPWTSITEAAARGGQAFAGIISEATKTDEVKVNKYGIITETIPADSVDWTKVSKDIAQLLKTSSLVSGVPGAAVIDEWVMPSLKRSEYSVVNKLGDVDEPNIVETQQLVHEFLTEHQALISKKTKRANQGKTLSDEDIKRMTEMSSTKSLIDMYDRYELYTPDSANDMKAVIERYNQSQRKKR